MYMFCFLAYSVRNVDPGGRVKLMSMILDSTSSNTCCICEPEWQEQINSHALFDVYVKNVCSATTDLSITSLP